MNGDKGGPDAMSRGEREKMNDDLCTLNDLKAWLPRQDSSKDAEMQRLITDGSTAVLSYMDRPHILAANLGALSEIYDGNDSDRLLPRQFPIIAVTGVKVDGIPIPQSTSPSTAGFLWDQRRVLLRGHRFNRGQQNVQLEYTAGYSAVPLDLRQAAIEAFALAWRERRDFNLSDVPSRSMSVFNQYRRLTL